MNFKEIEKLIENFSNQQVTKLNIKQGDFELLLEKNSSNVVSAMPMTQPVQTTQTTLVAPQMEASQPSPASVAVEGIFIQSPMVGTFYQAPSPDASPYVSVGDKVKKGQIVGIVEAMKIMNEIEAEFDCEIVEIVANDAQPVEFGSNLIKVKKL